eukprot:TRINITY_DN4641_c0_g2_i1.p2 TRINITY_DN4641_c0_g2~~TRINITY_DN4641_c0_g2_i1.p2  ORF type:complete len:155 (+),score=15.63 TRINITY_DN4641_c0_g2_i1:41-505(+)
MQPVPQEEEVKYLVSVVADPMRDQMAQTQQDHTTAISVFDAQMATQQVLSVLDAQTAQMQQDCDARMAQIQQDHMIRMQQGHDAHMAEMEQYHAIPKVSVLARDESTGPRGRSTNAPGSRCTRTFIPSNVAAVVPSCRRAAVAALEGQLKQRPP